MDIEEIVELDFDEYLEIKKSDIESALEIIKTYFNDCLEHYKWLEFKSSRFDPDYIPPYRWDYLYEYATIMENGIEGVVEPDDKRSIVAYFLMLITLFDKVYYVDFRCYPNLEKNFDILIQEAHCDWCVFVARSLFALGEYYVYENVQEAIKYYEAGASLNFDGRQTLLPFKVVADCNLASGILYYQGTEVEKNDDLAYKYFKTAIDTVGTSVIDEQDYPGVYELIRDYEEKHGLESTLF